MSLCKAIRVVIKSYYFTNKTLVTYPFLTGTVADAKAENNAEIMYMHWLYSIIKIRVLPDVVSLTLVPFSRYLSMVASAEVKKKVFYTFICRAFLFDCIILSYRHLLLKNNDSTLENLSSMSAYFECQILCPPDAISYT